MKDDRLSLEYMPFAGLTGSNIIQEYYDNLESLLKKYLDPEDVDKVRACAIYGARAHEGQKRKSGEPYFIHPIAVCQILARQRFDVPVLQAGLLHDVLEDTAVTKADMAKAFGGEVTRLVDGVSKLDQLRERGANIMQAESFRKMFVATADDPRVLIIKLADRLHNMLTLGSFRREKQRRISRETLDVYASIAGRLGLFYFRTQLEDLAFSYLYPWRYKVLSKYYAERNIAKEMIDQVRDELSPLLETLGIKATINQRHRHMWGLYQRILRKQKEFIGIEREKKQAFNDASRTVLVRIITDDEDNCYRILGRVHSLYRPVKEKFADYIAAPKSNGYRSLHTSVITAKGEVLNVQIRTRDMHTLSEMGIISVWHQYAKKRAVKLEQCSIEAEKTMRDWLSSLKEVQSIMDDPLEFYDAIKKELVLTTSDMYVYTPAGQVIDLPQGATPVDFAYAIHSKVGDYCVAAEVNGRPYPIYKPLKKGQTVRIIKGEKPNVHAGWEQFAVSPATKGKIRSFLRKMANESAAKLGKELLISTVERMSGAAPEFNSSQWKHYLEEQKMSEEALFIDIGRGVRQPQLVASILLGQQINVVDNENSRVLEVTSAIDSGLCMAECCHPLPRETIVGQMTDSGIVIHREACSFTQVAEREEIIRATWAKETQGFFLVTLKLQVGERRGLLSEISTTISNAGIDIDDLNPGKNSRDGRPRLMTFTIAVRDADHLANIMPQLRLIDQVLDISRT